MLRERHLLSSHSKCIHCEKQLDKTEYLTADGYYKFGMSICNKCKEVIRQKEDKLQSWLKRSYPYKV